MEKRRWKWWIRFFWDSFCNNRSNNNFMRMLNVLIFIICFILYLLNELLFKKNYNNIFFIGYYNDILAPLLLLSFSNILLDKYKKKILGAKSFIVIFICSIVWEILAPIIKKGAVLDVLDFVAYTIGCVIYNVIFLLYGIMKRIEILRK